MPALVKLCWHIVMEVSLVSLLRCMQLGWWDVEDTPAPGDLTLTGCEMWRIPPTHPSFSQMMWLWLDVKCGGSQPCHWQLRVEVTCTMWRTLPPSAVDSWSDMCNVEDPPPIDSCKFKWHVQCGGPFPHWQLRVEVTCAMWRTLPPNQAY